MIKELGEEEEGCPDEILKMKDELIEFGAQATWKTNVENNERQNKDNHHLDIVFDDGNGFMLGTEQEYVIFFSEQQNSTLTGSHT